MHFKIDTIAFVAPFPFHYIALHCILMQAIQVCFGIFNWKQASNFGFDFTVHISLNNNERAIAWLLSILIQILRPTNYHHHHDEHAHVLFCFVIIFIIITTHMGCRLCVCIRFLYQWISYEQQQTKKKKKKKNKCDDINRTSSDYHCCWK